MARPTYKDAEGNDTPLDVNRPLESDIIGQGAEEIRQTKQAIYSIFPIGPDDLDYNETSNWWPAGSLTGGFDPDVESGAKDPHDGMQDRYALVGDQIAVWDWQMPDNKNILTIGLNTGTANVITGQGTNWVNIENDDKVEPMRLHDLMDVFLGNVEPEDDDVLIYNDALSQWVNRPRSSLAADGADGNDGKGWTGTTVLQNDPTTYIIRFNSAYPELVFDTDNLRGPEGADGLSAYEQWLAAGNSGTEQDFLDSLQGANGASGADGADGDSAYQIALDNGFQGTEAEWLESLVGDEGPAGVDGHGLNFQGEVADEASLPGTANEGDTYKTTDTGHLWVYTDNGDWLDLGQVEGAPGEDGSSAYEIAVANGFQGDEAAWLESLVGDEGVTPTIVAGTATKLDHQASPTVTLSVVGNDTYQYDFGIPAGEPADPLDLEPLENAVADLQTDLNSIEGRVAQNESDISDIQSEQITQNNAIQANQDKNGEQDLRLDDLESDVADNASAIEANANAIIDIQNIQGGANTVPDPVKADDVLMSDGPDAYSWRTIDLAAIEDVRDKVYDHENQLHGNPDLLPPVTSLIERVDDLESRLGTEDPEDHVTTDELNTALYGSGTSPSDADDGVYASIQANTDLIEDLSTNTIPSLDARVGQTESDIATLQTSTGANATAIGVLQGRVDGHDTDISTNASDISAIKTQLTPGSHETILTSVDNGDGTYSTTWAPNEHIDDELPDYALGNADQVLTVVDNAGEAEVAWVDLPPSTDLSNPDAWLTGQYNETYQVTSSVWSLQDHPVSYVPNTISNVNPEPPTKNGLYASIIYEQGGQYTITNVVGTTDTGLIEAGDVHVTYVADAGLWKQLGLALVGSDGFASGSVGDVDPAGKVLYWNKVSQMTASITRVGNGEAHASSTNTCRYEYTPLSETSDIFLFYQGNDSNSGHTDATHIAASFYNSSYSSQRGQSVYFSSGGRFNSTAERTDMHSSWLKLVDAGVADPASGLSGIWNAGETIYGSILHHGNAALTHTIGRATPYNSVWIMEVER